MVVSWFLEVFIKAGFKKNRDVTQYRSDSTIKAKIERIVLLKLKVIFSEIFFMEFVVGTYQYLKKETT